MQLMRVFVLMAGLTALLVAFGGYFGGQGGAAGPDGLRAGLFRILGRDKDEVERRPGLVQFALQLKTAHALHAYVGHDAGILGPTSGLQKLGGAAKDAHLQTGGPQKPPQGPAAPATRTPWSPADQSVRRAATS